MMDDELVMNMSRNTCLNSKNGYSRMSCKQWTIATATFVLLFLSMWSFINAVLLCMSKYLLTDLHIFVPHSMDGPLKMIRTSTPHTITIVQAADPVTILQNIKLILEGASKAKNILDYIKDWPPTLIEYAKQLWNPTNDKISNKERSSYDFVIDLTRPSDIFTEWKSYPVTFPQGRAAYDAKLENEQKMISRFIVNVVGRYNTGKTFLLRLLANINLGHSFTERTNGISVALPNLRDTENTPMALIDTAGTRTPVSYSDETFKDLAYERQVSDSFIQEVAISSSEIFICVVNQLTLDDQLYLKTLYNRLIENNLTSKDIKQRLLIVHNYFNLRTVREVEETEKYELETLFKAVKQPQGYWLSENFKHFVISHTEGEGGKQYNQRSIEQIRAMIKGANADPSNDVLGTITKKIEDLLGKVLVEKPSGKENSESKTTKSESLSLYQRIRAFITTIPNRPMNLSPEKPVTVALTIESVNLDRDHTLWFICPKTPLGPNVTLSRNLKFALDGSVHVDYSSQFIPNVQVTRLANADIQILVECPSCEKSYTLAVRGQSMIIRGEKLNTKTNDVIHQYLSTNRLGPFEIEIPIAHLEKNYNYDIRKGAIKNVYENGVIIITVPALNDDEEL